MNPDTGEIKDFKGLGELLKAKEEGWIEWSLNEKVEIKGCSFIVKTINIAENTITLKGVGKTKVK